MLIEPGSRCIVSEEILNGNFDPKEFFLLDVLDENSQQLPLLVSIISRRKSKITLMTCEAFDKKGNEESPDSQEVIKRIGQIVTLSIVDNDADYRLGY